MKRLLCLLIVGLFLFPLVAEARRAPDHIGIEKAVGTSPGEIVRGDAKVWMVTLTGYTGPAWLTLYDSYEVSVGILSNNGEGDIIMEMEVASATSQTIVLEYPIDVSNGLYVSKTVGDGTYLILYE